jgi:hypothetical protein
MLDHIEIFGYRRLLNAHTYVGRKTVALVGPNEAGKSSVLSALRLFDSDDAVPERETTRSQRGQSLDADRTLVRLSVTLDPAQAALAKTLPIEDQDLRHLVFTKKASGARPFRFDPAPTLSPSVHDGLTKAWPALRRALDKAHVTVPKDADASFDDSDLDAISAFLETGGSQPAVSIWESINAGIDESLASDEKLTAKVLAFKTYFEWARPGAQLHSLVYQGIKAAMPVFVQFTDNLRSIRDEYLLADANIDADPALANLLRLARLSLDDIRACLSEPDRLRTLEDNANDRLAAFFTEKWKQEQITVGIKVTDEYLRIDVKDLGEGSPGWIRITERSDGLRTFVALASFLDSESFDRPPILLIDEAEQHLHQNAQGDLIRMLQDLSAVQQVIYTTHSPACLPADLGNGVRFVEPIANGNSTINHDFWSIDRNEHVGFNPLLIVMGAGAAAFSSLRSALIAEGVSDMLLLPTLIKLATGKPELSYQISPGIATASKSDMTKLDFVASRVAYLVDGDDGGKTWQGQLVEAGVPKGRVRTLPDDVGLEDLLDRDFYLDTVAELGGIDRAQISNAPSGIPIKTALEALKLKRKPPGPVAVAEFILGRHESGAKRILLDPEKKHLLRELDTWALKTIAG